jgi:hypothetical protein
MKNKIFLLTFLILLISCDKVITKQSNVKGVITEKYHKDAEDKFEYFYGYSMMKGGFCYHMGLNHYPEEFSTTILVNKCKQTYKYSDIYKKYDKGDSISMIQKIRIREKDKKALDTIYTIR